MGAGEGAGAEAAAIRCIKVRRLPPPPPQIFGLIATFQLFMSTWDLHPGGGAEPRPRLRRASGCTPLSPHRRLHGATLGERGGSIVRQPRGAGIRPVWIGAEVSARRSRATCSEFAYIADTHPHPLPLEEWGGEVPSSIFRSTCFCTLPAAVRG